MNTLDRRTFLSGLAALAAAPMIVQAAPEKHVIHLNIEMLPPDADVATALLINCYQRTQSLQLLKRYILVGMGHKFQGIEEAIKDDIAKYDERFDQLYDFFKPRLEKAGKTKELENLEKAKEIWEINKKVLLAPPKLEEAVKMYERDKEYIHLLGTMKVLGKKVPGSKQMGFLGKMCRIPMNMGIIYLLKVWGYDYPNYEEEMKAWVAKWNKMMKFLENDPMATPEIKKRLRKIKRAFFFFAFMYRSKGKIPTVISTKMDTAFDEIRAIRLEYLKMIREGKAATKDWNAVKKKDVI